MVNNLFFLSGDKLKSNNKSYICNPKSVLINNAK